LDFHPDFRSVRMQIIREERFFSSVRTSSATGYNPPQFPSCQDNESKIAKTLPKLAKTKANQFKYSFNSFFGHCGLREQPEIAIYGSPEKLMNPQKTST